MALEARIETVEGRSVLRSDARTNLPTSMPSLLGAMSAFGFVVREDFTLRGARPACDVIREHRFRTFRQGRWWNPSPFQVPVGTENVGGRLFPAYALVAAGVRHLRLDMCQDCGSVAVHDITPSEWAGARQARLVNRSTGATRIAPAVGSPDTIIGWYSGRRRLGREYR